MRKRSFVHDIDAGASAVAVGAVGLRAPHVGAGLVVCVADGDHIGGMVHVLASAELPAFAIHRPGFFIGSALPHLVTLMRGAGAQGELRAVFVGAAVARAAAPENTLAVRTLHAARSLALKIGLVIVDEFVGGPHVREVSFNGYGVVRVATRRETLTASLAGRSVPTFHAASAV